MSKLKRSTQNYGLGVAVENIDALIKSQGTELISAEQTKTLVSLESAGVQQQDDLSVSYEQVETQLREQLAESFGPDAVITEVGIEAASIAALGLGSPVTFARKALDTQVSTEGATVVNLSDMGAAGAMDFRLNASNEAFDETSLNTFAAASIAYNALAAAQDEFGETFFPTYVMSPDNTGLEVSVTRTMVFNEVRRDKAGNATDFGKINLVDALQDASILENDSTKVVPVHFPDGSRDDKFIDSTFVAPATVEIDGQEVPTAPLRIGATMDLLALTVGTGTVNGQVLDSTDSLDTRIGLQNIYLRVIDAAKIADPAAGEESILKVPVKGLPRSTFQKSQEGDSREMVLTFSNDAILLSKGTTDIEGNAAAALSTLNATDNVASLTVRVTGHVNVETSKLELNASPARIESMVNAEGLNVPVASGPGKAIVDGFQIEVVGFDLDASKSNSNRRTRGLLIDRTEIRERYTIPLGAPISAPAPLVNAADGASDLRALITTSRTRTANNAVTTLLNYADSLRATVQRANATGTEPSIEGIGRYLVKPTYFEIDLDLAAEINSTKSHEKAADASSVIVDAIRQLAYEMNRDSNYQAALDMETGGTQSKPKLVIGTDHVIAQHIMVSGDERTAGVGMDYKIVQSPDSRMDDKIVLTFCRDNNGQPDPLSFGTHAYMPELTSSATVSRDNATTKETQVQPRDLHVPHLPVMAVINIKNLRQVFTDIIPSPDSRA